MGQASFFDRVNLKILYQIFGSRFLSTPNFCGVKIKRAPAHSNNPQTLKTMTAIHSTSSFFTFTAEELRIYTIEVVTFDGDSHIIEIEAESAEEACEIAASQIEDADYTMVQAVA